MPDRTISVRLKLRTDDYSRGYRDGRDLANDHAAELETMLGADGMIVAALEARIASYTRLMASASGSPQGYNAGFSRGFLSGLDAASFYYRALEETTTTRTA